MRRVCAEEFLISTVERSVKPTGFLEESIEGTTFGGLFSIASLPTIMGERHPRPPPCGYNNMCVPLLLDHGRVGGPASRLQLPCRCRANVARIRQFWLT